MLSHFIPLELFSFCLLVGLEGVSAYPSPINRDLKRRVSSRRLLQIVSASQTNELTSSFPSSFLIPPRQDDTIDDAPISFSRGAKIGVIVGSELTTASVFLLARLDLAFLRNRRPASGISEDALS